MSVPETPLPQLLLAHPSRWRAQKTVVNALFPEGKEHQRLEGVSGVHGAEKTLVFPDANDTFHYHFFNTDLPLPHAGTSSPHHPILALLPSSASSSNEKSTKQVIVPPSPLSADVERAYTPIFSPSAFFAALDVFRTGRQEKREENWALGDVLFYSEVVTSTQTMLDKNHILLGSLPTPLVSFASTQLTGRGRGSNVWQNILPGSCMQMSTLIKVGMRMPPGSSVQPKIQPAIRSHNLVFAQYLFGIAVVQACKALNPSTNAVQWADRVKLKWPNDVYGRFPVRGEDGKTTVELKKLGGILTNSVFGNGTIDIIIGCGFNITTTSPWASLSELIAACSAEACVPVPDGAVPTVERTAAAILAAFDSLWTNFAEIDSFDGFLDVYHQSWLHTGQKITLTTTEPHEEVTIVGLTPDYGLLRAKSNRTGEEFALQPDGNSLDMMKGLIKAKK
ncbi:class II aaRS and biotin synthetase [Coniophora puteana RWD-64-598 SS2]|uniref:Class II aaRS and biotin synthetase n=1 Tax=Coniophora puteana (strain RWD-64-598) TaxID=741705 RepID=A0A5M3MR36_CONPW|nr:class II aaRS and biotin synthetase [Coniophora puteana RWD-64-598 SS2]EIW81642.1 class II aaRS and biotin synthetase [Coniophora puteana RWD-64-598 SS2]